jgi:hypothetical protein
MILLVVGGGGKGGALRSTAASLGIVPLHTVAETRLNKNKTRPTNLA